MKRIFVGTGLMRDLQDKNKQSSQASSNFFESLKKTRIFDCFLIIPPGNVAVIDHKPTHGIIQLVNNFFLKSGRIKHLGVLYANLKAFNAIRRIKPAQIWIYNVNSTNIFLHLLLALTNRKSFLMLADRYFHNSNKLMQKLEKYIVKRQSGYILLREAYLELPINGNYKILQGIIAQKPTKKKTKINKSLPLNVLFSGLLSYRNGIGLFLEMVKRFRNDERLNFQICGINAEDLNFNEFSLYNNFNYYGSVGYDKYLELLAEADICPSFRDPKAIENTYEFPSKIFEYYSANKLIITTMTYVGISADLIIPCNFNLESVAIAMEEILTNYHEHIEKDVDLTLYEKYDLKAWKENILEIETFSPHSH